MNIKEYNNDPRYWAVWEKMQLLGIMDISTKKQDNNGTVVWRLPIKYGKDRLIEVASFATGYVRNQNGGYTNYQLNKRCESEPQYYELANGNYSRYTTRSCVLIPNEIDRLEYLIAYCLKNYYIKNANQVANGKYVAKWYHEYELEKANKSDCDPLILTQQQILDLEDSLDSSDYRIKDLERMLDGYKTREKDLENKLGRVQEQRDDLHHDLSEQKVRQDVSVIVNGHRYKVL